MSTYKITNITNTISKRDIKYNSILNIEYHDNMEKKIVNIKPGEEILLTTISLPISVQRLKIKNLITVIEITQSELNKSQNNSKINTVKPIDKKIVVKETINKKIEKNSEHKIEKKNESKLEHQQGKKKIDKKDDDLNIEDEN